MLSLRATVKLVVGLAAGWMVVSFSTMLEVHQRTMHEKLAESPEMQLRQMMEMTVQHYREEKAKLNHDLNVELEAEYHGNYVVDDRPFVHLPDKVFRKMLREVLGPLPPKRRRRQQASVEGGSLTDEEDIDDDDDVGTEGEEEDDDDDDQIQADVKKMEAYIERQQAKEAQISRGEGRAHQTSPARKLRGRARQQIAVRASLWAAARKVDVALPVPDELQIHVRRVEMAERKKAKRAAAAAERGEIAEATAAAEDTMDDDDGDDDDAGDDDGDDDDDQD